VRSSGIKNKDTTFINASKFKIKKI